MRNPARGKGHEEGGLTYAKAGSSLRGPPGNSRASTPKTRVCLLYCVMLPPTLLTLTEGCPLTTFFLEKVNFAVFYYTFKIVQLSPVSISRIFSSFQ